MLTVSPGVTSSVTVPVAGLYSVGLKFDRGFVAGYALHSPTSRLRLEAALRADQPLALARHFR